MDPKSTPSYQKPPRRSHDWPAIVAAWKASGLSRTKFCQERGLPGGGLSTAIRKLDQGFVAAELPRRNAASITIDLPCGVRITAGDANLAQLVQQLLSKKF